jgi:hypothetical protein
MARRVMGVAVVMLLTSACASTTLSQVYKVPEPGPKPTKVLVVAVLPQQTSRRILETELARRLKGQGMQAALSTDLAQDGQTLDRAAVEELVRREGFDAVLVSRYAGTQESVSYVSPTYTGGFYGYYGMAYSAAYSPGYTVQNETVRVETLLYRAEGEGKLVWGAVSESFNPSNAHEVIQDVASAVTDRMAADKVI